MINAYLYHQTDGFSLGSDIEAARRALDDPNAVLWLDLEGEHGDVLDRVGKLFCLNEGAIDDADDNDQRPRIDDYGDYLFILMYAALAPEDPPSFSPRQLAIFFSKNFLITIHNEPIRAIHTAAERVKRLPARTLGRGLDFAFFHIVDTISDNFVVCAEMYEEVLDDLDEQSMQDSCHKGILTDLTQFQRTLIRMRRMVSAQRELAAQIAGGEYEFIGDEVDKRFEHIYQHLTHTFELIEGMRETGHSIRDNYYALLAERTNSLMRTLTIFSTFIMPLSLITGIYGMNVDIWPHTGEGYSFLFVGILMATSSVCMFIYFRKRKWI